MNSLQQFNVTGGLGKSLLGVWGTETLKGNLQILSSEYKVGRPWYSHARGSDVFVELGFDKPGPNALMRSAFRRHRRAKASTKKRLTGMFRPTLHASSSAPLLSQTVHFGEQIANFSGCDSWP